MFTYMTKNHFIHFHIIKSILFKFEVASDLFIATQTLKKMYHKSKDKRFAYMNTTFMTCNNVYCSRETDKDLKVQFF